MKRILVATVLTSSQDDEQRRVSISCPTVWDRTPLVASVNGLFLRVGEKVYVEVSEDFNDPLIIGRVGNWIDGDEILTLFNKLVSMINENVDAINAFVDVYNGHTHACTDGATATQSLNQAVKTTEKEEIVIDEIFHVDNPQ